jgi:hypothetical protein
MELSPEKAVQIQQAVKSVIADLVGTGMSREEAEEKLASLIQHATGELPAEEDVRYRKTKSRRRQKPTPCPHVRAADSGG